MFTFKSIKSFLFLFFALLTVAHANSRKQPKSDIYSYVSQYEPNPYSISWEDFKQKFSYGIDTVLKIVSVLQGEHYDPSIKNQILSSFGSDADEDMEYYQKQKSYRDSISKKGIPPKQNSRNLGEGGQPRELYEGICHKGFPISTWVRLPICNGVQVMLEYYERVKDNQDCHIENIETELCYCPADYFGRYCEEQNKLVCSVEKLNYENGCEGEDSYYYVYSISEPDFEPCHFIEGKEKIEMRFRGVCEYEYPQLAGEGIKHTWMDYDAVNLEGDQFNYTVNYGNIKLTSDENPEFTLKFYNWDRVTAPYEMKKTITNTQMLGAEEISLNVEFNEELKKYMQYGRYFYEYSLSNSYNRQPQWGVFDDRSYKEPQNLGQKILYDTQSRAIFVAGTLVCLLIIGFICFKCAKWVKYIRGDYDEYQELHDEIEMTHLQQSQTEDNRE